MGGVCSLFINAPADTGSAQTVLTSQVSGTVLSTL
eukprot:COSAG05_NODE_12658_length_459_cov_1.136111_1_plen_34_part_01